MRQSNKHIFWNLIYYFNEYQLPFEFILPYEDTKVYDQQYYELKKMASQVQVLIQRDDIEEDLKLEQAKYNTTQLNMALKAQSTAPQFGAGPPLAQGAHLMQPTRSAEPLQGGSSA